MAKFVAAKDDAAHIAALRVERDRRLTASDWTQLADNRLRLGDRATAWDTYRAACRKVVADAKSGVTSRFPDPPTN